MQHAPWLYRLVFLALSFPQLAAAGEPLTLAQAIAQTESNNPALAAEGEYARAMQAVAPQVGSLPDPVFSLNALNLPTNSFSGTQEAMSQFQLGISQALPLPHKRELRAAIADLNAEAVSLNRDEFRLQSIYLATALWWNIFYLDHALATVSRNQQLLRQLIQVAESKYSVGQGLQQDVLLAQVELSKLLDMAIQLQSARRQDRVRLNALRHVEVHQGIDLPAQVSEQLEPLPAEAKLIMQALHSRPLLAQAHTRTRIAHAQHELAEQDFYPDFDLGAAYGIRQGSNRANLASIRLSMSLPFFTSDKQNHRLQQRKAEVAQAEFAYDDAKDRIQSELSQAIIVYEQAREQSRLFKLGIIPQAQQTVAAMRAAYQVNAVDFLNLVRAQITLYNYENQYWKAVAEARQSLAKVERTIGAAIDLPIATNMQELSHE